jgi:hypothetical protein
MKLNPSSTGQNITEIMSDPKVPAAVLDLFKSLPALEVTEGYRERAEFAFDMSQP